MIVDSQTMTQIDKLTISQKIPGIELMENAGKACANTIFQKFHPHERDVYVIAGGGNNGGDGFVISRLLLEKKYKVKTLILTDKTKISGDALKNLLRLNKVIQIESIKDLKNEISHEREKIIIDAIFGTGLKREVGGLYLDAINYINNINGFKLSVDIPSGVCASTGKVLGSAINADLTVTFGLPKFGHFIYPGKKQCGFIKICDIGFPPEIIEQFEINDTLLTPKTVKSKFITREKDSYKNNYGHLLIVAGSIGKAGAAALVSKAAFKSGAGLVTLFTPESIFSTIQSQILETMIEPLQASEGSITYNSFTEKISKIKKPTVVAFGPGVGITSETEKILNHLLEKNYPLIIDADGIRILKKMTSILKDKTTPTIITPHLGEFSFFTDLSVEEIISNKLDIVKNTAKNNNIYILLKGNDSIISTPKGHVSINSTGNPSMANAGQGDALTGFISGFMASKYDPRSSVELATFLHGLTGDILLQETPIGITASQIINNFSRAVMATLKD